MLSFMDVSASVMVEIRAGGWEKWQKRTKGNVKRQGETRTGVAVLLRGSTGGMHQPGSATASLLDPVAGKIEDTPKLGVSVLNVSKETGGKES